MPDPTYTIPDQMTIRTYRPDDHGEVRRLYERGRLVVKGPLPESTADLDNIEQTYLSHDRVHFWVAEYRGAVVGMVGLAACDDQRAEVRRLRVDPDKRGVGVAARLMETVLPFCRHHGYLKVIFNTHMEQDGEARELFDRFAFKHDRNRVIDGREIQEYYVDLYREPRADGS